MTESGFAAVFTLQAYSCKLCLDKGMWALSHIFLSTISFVPRGIKFSLDSACFPELANAFFFFFLISRFLKSKSS